MFSCMCGFFSESIRSRYIVKKIIGEGGYGKVYEGIRISDGKKVDKHFALTLKSVYTALIKKKPTDSFILKYSILHG